ncbi:MAG: hypothetical protein V1729_02935 [Candidatus Woesearchaeota archaeon]
MKDCDITYESKKKITFDEFVAKGNALEELVNDILPGRWKNPVVLTLEPSGPQHYNLPGTIAYSDKLDMFDQKAWKRSSQASVIFNGYPNGFYNIAQLVYDSAAGKNKLTCTALWWSNDKMKQEIYDRLFGGK